MDISLSEYKNVIIRYLVQSHIGHLFQDGTIKKEQISVDISGGHAYLRQLELDVTFLNEVGEQLNFPLRVVRGYLNVLHIHAPWRKYFSDGLSLATEFQGLHLTFEPIEDIDDAASMWSSAIGRLVEKSSTYKSDGENPVLLNEGAKKVDDFFRYLMSKLTIEFKDTVIYLQPRNSELGLKLIIKLDSLRFYDDNDENAPSEKVPDQEYCTKNRVAGSLSNNIYTTKSIDIEGVSLSMVIPKEDVRSRKEKNEPVATDPENEKQNEDEIKFAILTGKQKIKILVKETERNGGPGLWISSNLGDFISIVTPRQVYLLTEFMKEYCETDNRDDNSQQRTRPMTASDFQRVESILQQENPQYMGLQMGHGWSSSPTDEVEEQFYSMNANHQLALGYSMSVAGSMDDSVSLHSTIFSERPSTITRMNSRGMTSNYSRAMSTTSVCTPRTSHDPGRDMFLIELHISSVAVILLHEDILNVTEDCETYTQKSFINLRKMSSKFFEKMMNSNFPRLLIDDNINKFLDNNCNVNHIRLLAAPAQFSLIVDPLKKKYEGILKTYRLSVSEYLFENEDEAPMKVPLVIFKEPTQECLSLSMVTCSNRSNSDCRIMIHKCTVVLDITLMDRLSALLNVFGGKAEKESTQSRDSTNFEVHLPNVDFILRFPIPDFTPLHDPNRIPWWKRNVRQDYMTLKCHNSKFETNFSSPDKTEYNFEFKILDIYYNNESRMEKPIYIAQIGDEDDKYDPCSISLKILPTTVLYDVEEREDPATERTFCKKFLEEMDNGPFTSKKIYHQSRADHIYKDNPEPDDFLIPGDCKEINKFKESSRDSAKMIFDIILSSVKIQIISKHTYEMIYNRISNDLLMWEPTAPISRFGYKENKEVTFKECRSGTAQFDQFGNDMDDHSDREDYSLFYSTYEGPKLSDDDSSSLIKKYVNQSNMVIDLKIINGTIAFNPPVRDASLKNVIPGQLGYFTIDLRQANVFLVTGYKGDSALDYLCIDVNSCDMRHHEMMPSYEVRNCLPDLKQIPSHLYPVISKSVGTLVEERRDQPERQMLTVAFKISTTHETHYAKTARIALGLSKATIHHRVTAEPNTWLSQLIDFFKVTDLPIPGYKSKDVLSEFHLHTWDCAIDYRPLYLPLRCAVTLGSFNMTSNVNEKARSSKLRFIAENVDLYLSQDNPPKDGIASNVPLDIKREYINIVTMNIFELSLVVNEEKSQTQCGSDLRVSTDYLRIHSCSDTLQALTHLIGYIASEGDLLSPDSTDTNDIYASPRRGPKDQTLISVEPQAQESLTLSEREQQELNDLIDQAIQDVTEQKEYKPPKKERKSGRRFPQVQNELGDSDSDDDLESSFIIIEKPIPQKPNGGPILESTNIVTQLFDPPDTLETYDPLESPADFPMPEEKYTLCEINIIWQLYGGKDFSAPQKRKDSQSKETYSTYSSNESLYSRSSNSSFHRERRNSENVGGINRNNDILMEVVINKLRCEYDIYPKSTEIANRFVLLIKEYEIIDKMKSSDFNKFLCLHISESTPKPDQGYMFSITAVNRRSLEMAIENECSIDFSLLPLRVYIDQESLEFLRKFFIELRGGTVEVKDDVKVTSKHSTPVHQPPKLVVKYAKKKKEEPENDEDENLINLENFGTEERSPSPEYKPSRESFNKPVYFRPITFSQESFVKVDYKGKCVGGSDKSVTGVVMSLIIGLAEINNSKIRLKRFENREGILGIGEVLHYIMGEWSEDIKKNQLQNLLISVGPMQSVVQLVVGIRDLICCPFEQYQKDGRFIKGLRRGANSFTTSTALAALELTFKFIHILQSTAETAYDILSPGPSVRQLTLAKKKKKRYTRPQDIRQGVTNALWLFKDGIEETAGTIAKVAVQEHEQKGVVGVVGGIARQIPPNILLKPIIIASEATNNVLGGIRSQLDPDAKTEANQKWRNFE